MASTRLLRVQHQRRLSWMPWLYFTLKPRHRVWAEAWQKRIRERLERLETVRIHPTAFIAPEARIFAEPGRAIEVGPGAYVAAFAFVHGPVKLEQGVSVNAGVSMDGGSAGIRIGSGARIASGASLYAFDHGMASDRPIREQPVRSRGIDIGREVWIGARAGITDGVRIGDHAVVGMGAVVTTDVDAGMRVGGVPARPLRGSAASLGASDQSET